MERISKAPEKNPVSQGQSSRQTDDPVKRRALQSDAEHRRRQNQPAADQRRASSSNELKIKPGEYGASRSHDANLRVLQSAWQRDSVVSNSSHEKKSYLSQQHRRPIQRGSSESHLAGARLRNAADHQKVIPPLQGGGGCWSKPSDDSSSQQQTHQQNNEQSTKEQHKSYSDYENEIISRFQSGQINAGQAARENSELSKNWQSMTK